MYAVNSARSQYPCFFRPSLRDWVVAVRLLLAIYGGAGLSGALSADTAPAITRFPVSQSVVAGQNAIFTVEASGTDPLSYQWYKGNSVLSGATSASLTIESVQAADAASYSVTVKNATGTARTFTSFGSAFAGGSGSSHSLFVKSDGMLWATGYNSSGQLGDGSTLFRSFPVQVSANVNAVAAGNNHSLFVKTDGTLWAMGSNASGQLGDGTTTGRMTPIQITTGVRSLAANGTQSFFIKTDGSLWGAGSNASGQLGDGTTTNRTAPVQLATNVALVTAGGNHTLFVKDDGSMWAMGSNSYGQCGQGTTSYMLTTPMQVATGVKTVSAGNYHSLYVKTDGSLFAMGYNYSGQLGTGVYSYYQATPVPVQVSAGVTAVLAGANVSFYLRNDGTLWGMGSNSSGQFGDGSTSTHPTPVMVILPGENPALLTVLLPPKITSQPISQTVSGGGSAMLSVAATGSPPITYQWYQAGVPITGATNSSYTVTAFSIAKAGTYTVTVTNPAGQVSSQPAILSLGLPLLSSQTAITGKGTSFLAATGGSGTVAWQVSRDEGVTWTNLTDGGPYEGTQTFMLEIKSVTPDLGNCCYRYTVTSNDQSVTSTAAALKLITSPFSMPSNLVHKSDALYVTDVAAQCVFKIGPDMKLTILAGKNGVMGSTDGPGTEARFNEPSGFIMADDGSIVLADAANAAIRAISATGRVSTLAGQKGITGAVDGDASTALFNVPVGMSADLAGVYLVTDQANHLVRAITGGRVYTLAGKAGIPGVADGTGSAATFNLPTGITIRRDTGYSSQWTGGNNGYGTVFVSDQGSNTIRTVLANGQVGTYVGAPGSAGSVNGYRTSARLNKPSGLTMDGDGNLYIADTGNHTIRKVNVSGSVTTYAGVPTVSGLMDGAAAVALFNAPEGLIFDNDRNLYVADTGNAAIRKISPTGQVTTLAIQGNVPVITTQPASQTQPSGSTVTFVVAATSEGTLNYQWKKDNAAVPGATQATYTLASVSPADAGNFSVVVSNSWGETTSNTATLTVTPAPLLSSPTPLASSGTSGGGGGGGAPSWYFLALIGAAAGLRRLPFGRLSGNQSK